jgi:hypothetical protein
MCRYSEIHKEGIRNLESKHCTVFFFFKRKRKARDFITKVQPLHYPTVKEDQCRGITAPLKKIFGLGFKRIKVNVKNLIFLFY